MIPTSSLTVKESESSIYSRVQTGLDVAVETVQDLFGKLFCCLDCGETTEENSYKRLSRKSFAAPSTSLDSTQLLRQSVIKAVQVESQLIWDKAPSNAFTGLIYFQNQFFCCFRVGKNAQAAGEHGKIQIISSSDAKTWKPVALLACKGYDLRDPKLSETPDGRLLLNMGATLWEGNNDPTLNSAVSFSANGLDWDEVNVLPYKGQWIWRVTWNKGKAYGTAYSFANLEKTSTQLKIVESLDGIHYKDLKKFHLNENPNEATLRFLSDQTMVALVRCNIGGGLIGTSSSPYTNWKWTKISDQLGGPNFIVLNDDSMLASSRQTIDNIQTCILARMTTNSYTPELTLKPSGGDCGYPDMVYRDGKLYVSYYTTQNAKTVIYLATVQLSNDPA